MADFVMGAACTVSWSEGAVSVVKPSQICDLESDSSPFAGAIAMKLEPDETVDEVAGMAQKVGILDDADAIVAEAIAVAAEALCESRGVKREAADRGAICTKQRKLAKSEDLWGSQQPSLYRNPQQGLITADAIERFLDEAFASVVTAPPVEDVSIAPEPDASTMLASMVIGREPVTGVTLISRWERETTARLASMGCSFAVFHVRHWDADWAEEVMSFANRHHVDVVLEPQGHRTQRVRRVFFAGNSEQLEHAVHAFSESLLERAEFCAATGQNPIAVRLRQRHNRRFPVQRRSVTL